MLASSSSLLQRPQAVLGKQQSARPKPHAVSSVRCQAEKGNESSYSQIRDKAAVLMSGLAASCLVFHPSPALAEGATATVPKAKIEADIQAALAERKATLEKLEAAPQLVALENAPNKAELVQTKAKLQDELLKENARLAKLSKDLEATLTAAIKKESELKTQLTKETAELKKLASELEAAKASGEGEAAVKAKLDKENTEIKKLMADLENVKKEIVSEKQLMVSVKAQAKQAQQQLDIAETERLLADVEKSKANAVKSVEQLQVRLAAEHSEVLRLRKELGVAKTKAEEEGNKLEEARQRTQAAEKATEAERKKLVVAQQETAVAKGETEKERTALAAAQKKTETLKKELEEEKQRVDATEKQIVAIKAEVEKEKQLLTAAQKQAAEAKAAAEAAAEAARKRGFAPIEIGSLHIEPMQALSVAGVLGVAGWGTAAYMATNRRTGDDSDMQMLERESLRSLAQMEGVDNVLAAREEAARAEAASLRRELSALKGEITQLATQREQERSHSETLRETVAILEAEYARMEGMMLEAKSEALELEKKMGGVNGSSSSTTSSRPTTTSRPSLASSRPSSSLASSLSSSKTPSASSLSALASLAQTGRGGVRVRFSTKQELPFGQSLLLVGNHPSLGGWDEKKGPTMTWGDGHVWTNEVSIPAGTSVEFKCVRVINGQEGGSQWEEGPNHTLVIPSSGVATMGVKVEWNGGMEITSQKSAAEEYKSGINGTNGFKANGNSNGYKANGSSLGKESSSINGSGSSSDKKKELVGASSSSSPSKGGKWGGLLG